MVTGNSTFMAMGFTRGCRELGLASWRDFGLVGRSLAALHHSLEDLSAEEAGNFLSWRSPDEAMNIVQNYRPHSKRGAAMKRDKLATIRAAAALPAAHLTSTQAIHGDCHQSNVLLSGSGAQWIDFDNTTWFIPAYDLVRLVVHVGAQLDHSGHSPSPLLQSLVDGYRSVRDDGDLRTGMAWKVFLQVQMCECRLFETAESTEAMEFMDRRRLRLRWASNASDWMVKLLEGS